LLTCLLFASAFQSTRPAEPQIAGKLQPFVDGHALAGAVTLVSSADRTVSLEAVGYSDVGAKTPMTTDNLFWIASMTKPMTATALMMLVDEGKVHLDDPVEKYLPEYRNQLLTEKDAHLVVIKKPEHRVTVRNVLSHTGGLVGQSPQQKHWDEVPLRTATVTYGRSLLQYEPGTKYLYSNTGINTVGRIVEVASGMPYEKFMERRLFDPLGMKDTTFWPSEEQVKRVAKSYKPNAKRDGLEEIPITQLTYPLTDRKRQPYPAGGLFSTAADVAVFCRMILNGGVHNGRRLVSEASVRAMTSTQTGTLLNQGKGEHGYGFGWSTAKYSHGDSGPVIPGTCGHGGAYATNMSIDPERRLITVFMVQHDGFGNGGEQIMPTFQKATDSLFAKSKE
jgi:CubicO group peptidase (beta-lactamase class C family)